MLFTGFHMPNKKSKTKKLVVLALFLTLSACFATGCTSTDTGEIRDASGISTGRIGVMTGSIGEIYAEEKYPDATMQMYDSLMDSVLALSAGQVDYVITAYTNALTYKKSNGDLTYLPERLTDEETAIAIGKDNTRLLESINAVLTQFKEDGTLDDIITRWVKEDDSPYEQVDIPAVKGGEELKVAISTGREPMVFVQDNNYVGLDCELIERIAYELGMSVTYSDMSFSALIPALTSGRADCVISNMTATEERAKQVNFSHAYFSNPQVVMIRNPDYVSSKPWYESIKDSFIGNFITENRWILLAQGLLTTVIVSVLSATLGTVLGFGVCMLHMNKNSALSGIARVYIEIIRGIPVLVLLMLLFYVVLAGINIDPVLVAVITFSLNFSAYVSELMRTSIGSVDKGQVEAATATGFAKWQRFTLIVFPQAARIALPVFRGELISMVKMTSVVGYIAIMDLTKASDIIRARTFDAAFPLIVTAILYFIISTLLVSSLSRLEKNIDPKKRKREVKLDA
ncbi:ABC transporter substrate-binding protein/permease [Christensenellaceae bacterium OttesenSCG-928-K19]|nr:ABC transporter substrate-binding protein/permease [Christensenellaceae bacterium OttesenSCG-928-K19]